MPTEPNTSGNHDLPKGLPAVAPPSGRFIMQLFLVPGLIVLVLVLIYLWGSLMTGGTSQPEAYLSSLDSPNPDIRWRAAHELAQVLERPESLALASDPKFALDLAERLSKALDALEQAEQATLPEIAKAEKSAQQKNEPFTEADRKALWRKLRPQRDHVLFLIGCLGHFTVPVGAPLLCDIAVKDTGPEVKGLTQRRRVALMALANLGSNYQRRFLGQKPQPKDQVLSAEQKDTIHKQIEKELAEGGQRGEWAKQALDYMDKKPSALERYRGQISGLFLVAPFGPLSALPLVAQPLTGIDAALERCAYAGDPDLRNRTAMALNFWEGDRIEVTLLRLARDDGRGIRIEIDEDD